MVIVVPMDKLKYRLYEQVFRVISVEEAMFRQESRTLFALHMLLHQQIWIENHDEFN